MPFLSLIVKSRQPLTKAVIIAFDFYRSNLLVVTVLAILDVARFLREVKIGAAKSEMELGLLCLPAEFIKPLALC